MNNAKSKMSASYKAIFVLSIFMVFFVLIAGAATKSKSSGLGMWIWGYTAYLMYKRRVSDLVSFYKVLLWFDVIAAGIAVSVLAFSDSDVVRYVGYSVSEAFILFALVISVTYGLFKYFSKLSISGDDSLNSNVSDEGILWEQVSEEIKRGERVDSLWARAFSDADGDANKANARYIKLRVKQLAKSKKSYSSEIFRGSIQAKNSSILKRNYLSKSFVIPVFLFFIILIGYHLSNSFQRKRGPVTSYMGINLNSTMDEVQYALGFPTYVYDVDPVKLGDGTILGLFIAAKKEDINSKGINNFFYWQYGTSDHYIDVGFDPNERKVISIGCYVSDSSPLIPKECEILKFNVKEDESVIKDRLGSPFDEKLIDVTKTLYYKDINLNLRFHKKKLYYIIVGTEDIASVIDRHNHRIKSELDYCIEAQIKTRGKFDDLALKHGALNVKSKQEVESEAKIKCMATVVK